MRMKLIGETPMIKIIYRLRDRQYQMYAKLEYYNLTGSIKDRMIEFALSKAKERGELHEGMPIVEATSGNTGISLAAFGAFQNHPVQIFMPDWVSHERKELMELFGAHVTLLSKEEGGFLTCIARAKEYAEKEHAYLLGQFHNPDNVQAHYETSATEILNQVPNVDAFVSGIGTGGTLIGIGKKLKEKNNTKVVALEPEQMSLLKLHTNGDHKIEGIGDEFLPDLVDLTIIDEVVTVNDEDAVNMARKLAQKLGLGVGISSGANFLGTVLIGEHQHGTIVTVFPDDSKKYLSTTLVDEIDPNSNFLSNQIELLTYEIV